MAAAPPRENKENEVHLSISMAQSNPCQQVRDEQASEELCIIPSGSAEQCFTTKKHNGPKKNYEQLAPYKFFCTMCSFKTKRESHYQRHLEKHETVSSILISVYLQWLLWNVLIVFCNLRQNVLVPFPISSIIRLA